MVGMISLFSYGWEWGEGLTVLIKSVLQFLHIYTLSALTHLKGTRKLIEKHLVVFFFWDSRQGRNKFQSCWLNLCVPCDESCWLNICVPCDEGVLVSQV